MPCSGSSCKPVLGLAPAHSRDQIGAMQSENPLIADIVKLANSAAGTFAGMTREARQGARERMKEALGGLDFVSRGEFDAVKDMASRAREDCARLEARVAELESKLDKYFPPGTGRGTTRRVVEGYVPHA